MKKIRKKIKKKEPVLNNDNYQVKSFIIIVIVLLVLSSILYFITNLVIKENKKDEDNKESQTVEIQNEKILMGQLLNRTEDSYYVLAYVKDDQFMKLYETYLNQIKTNESSAVYKIDLNEGLNKKYVQEETYISDNLNELSVSETVLFEIKDKKIDNYYIGHEEIIDYLKGKING